MRQPSGLKRARVSVCAVRERASRDEALWSPREKAAAAGSLSVKNEEQKVLPSCALNDVPRHSLPCDHENAAPLLARSRRLLPLSLSFAHFFFLSLAQARARVAPAASPTPKSRREVQLSTAKERKRFFGFLPRSKKIIERREGCHPPQRPCARCSVLSSAQVRRMWSE